MSPILDSIGSVKSYGWGAAVAAGAYESIATITATGGETSMAFTSIPTTYTTLQIRGIARDTSAAASNGYITMRFNSDTAGNYRWQSIASDGSSNSPEQNNTATSIRLGALTYTISSSATGSIISDIHNYSSSSKQKSIFSKSGARGVANMTTASWLSNSAVTRIDLIPPGTAFASGTTFSLYGIV